MLSYELCKELKDAGFPQQLNHGDWAFCVDCHGDNFKDDDDELHLMHYDNDEGGFVGNNYNHRWEDYHKSNWVKVPALSELIEAVCSKGNAISLRGSTNGAWAVSLFSDTRNQYGDTPEEAVARLWLSLHNK